MQPMDRVELTGQTLTCAQVRAVARRRAQARVSADAWARVRRSADLIARIVATQPVYGRTTGVGANRTVAIAVDPRGRAEHGSALLRSHAGGAGPLLDADRARAMLVVRLNQLAAGWSSSTHPMRWPSSAATRQPSPAPRWPAPICPTCWRPRWSSRHCL